MSSRIALFLMIVLVSCANPMAQPTAETMLSSTRTATLTSTTTPEPSLTATATFTPTPVLPVLVGTTVPQPSDTISVGNADQLRQVARWGRGSFIDATYSPDGDKIAVTTTIGVYILDAETLKEQYFFSTAYAASHTKYLPDGKRIAIAYRDTIEIISVSDGSSLAIFSHPDADDTDNNSKPVVIKGMALSANGEFIAAAYSDSTLDLWRISNGELVSDLTVLENKVTKELKRRENLFRDGVIGIALSPDGTILYVGLSSLKIIAFNINENQTLREFISKYEIGIFQEMTLSSDGSTLVAHGRIKGSGDTFLTIWQSGNGLLIREIRTKSWLVFALSPDGRNAFTLSFLFTDSGDDNGALDFRLEAWDLRNDDPQKLLGKYALGPFQLTKKLAVSPDGNRLLMFDESSFGNNFRVLDVQSGEVMKSSESDYLKLFNVSLSSSGNKIAVIDAVTGLKGIRIINTVDGASYYTLENIKSIQRIRYTPDGKNLFVASWDTLYLFPQIFIDPPYNATNGSGNIWLDLPGRYSRPLDIAVSQNFGFYALRTGAFVGHEEILAYRSRDQEFFSMNLLPFTNLLSEDWTTLEFSDDEEYMAVGVGKLRLIRTRDWETIADLDATHGTFSPDSAYFAYGQVDNSIRVSTLPDLKPVFTTVLLPDVTRSLAYSPDGSIFATGSNDGTLRLWNASDGTLLKEINAHNGTIGLIEFFSDGKTLLTFGYDATIRLWRVIP